MTPESIRTKIVATLGPATDDLETMRALVRAGMTVARINLSHGTREQHAVRIARVREAARLESVVVAVLLDLQGPRLRIGRVEPNAALVPGAPLVLDGRRSIGDGTAVGLTFARRVAASVSPGHHVLIDDGRIELVVRRVEPSRILTEVVHGGVLCSRKGVNLTHTRVELPTLTDKDRADARFALACEADYIALSFVGSAEHVNVLQRFIRREGGSVPVIAKIERREAEAQADAIIEQADGVMVARGDLALEVGPAHVPVVQKRIIGLANAAAKPVITATQMLESMIHAAKPTRAETSDVANAILDGSDAVMLSGETAIGAHPVAAVAEMASIAAEIERVLPYQRLGRRGRRRTVTVTRAISAAAVEVARRTGVRAIIAATTSGITARAAAHYRPEMPILGATWDEALCRRLALVWGVVPLPVAAFSTTDEMVRVVGEAAQARGFVTEGDLVAIISGQPIGQEGSTNMVQVRRIGDWRTPGTDA